MVIYYSEKMYNEEIKLAAHDKAFAKIYFLKKEVQDLKRRIKQDDLEPFMTKEQTISMLNAAIRQLHLWNYLAKLIELDYNKIEYL